METALKTIDNKLKEAEIFIGSILSVAPEQRNIRLNKAAKNAKYIPISVVENQLDEIFIGAWEEKEFHYQVVANEIIGSLQLRFFHPILNIWLERTGCASVQIQMKSKDNGGDGDITNVRNKITNTLEKDFPHLKAECVKNAARSIGKVFGRDLNRDIEDDYQPLSDTLELANDIKDKLSNCSSFDEIRTFWELLSKEQQETKLIIKLFTNRKNQIKYGQ